MLNMQHVDSFATNFKINSTFIYMEYVGEQKYFYTSLLSLYCGGGDLKQ